MESQTKGKKERLQQGKTGRSTKEREKEVKVGKKEDKGKTERKQEGKKEIRHQGEKERRQR